MWIEIIPKYFIPYFGNTFQITFKKINSVLPTLTYLELVFEKFLLYKINMY